VNKKTMSTLDQLQANSLSQVQGLSTLNDLESVRVSLLGKNGEITSLLKTLGTLPAEERKAFGKQVNDVKVAVAGALEEKKTVLETALLNERLASESVDVTLPAEARFSGKMHPVSYVIEEVEVILGRLGFSTATGPEVETDFYNFTALNIPENHPARQDHDTFYLKNLDADGNRRLLRTQTSNVQIHTMEKFEPPMRVMSIGRVYRNDSDLTHTPQFHQVEGLALDKNLTFGHLKGTLLKFLEEYFDRDITMRLRPSYFPFTEPGAEVDIECLFCKGEGCRICSHTGWLEVLGSGMVHRNVLKAGGLHHEDWQGFAFGAGIERLAMLKYGITDLRLFYESGISFLKHFGKPSTTMKV
jgi:phenylalanyl-tRNA synthetase alpha chain